ncbi:MAG: aldo/keto reductase [Oscillospiraceae bacterium]|nr:aldo/keto reductase [Oscillospiraceae bacterium]
MIYRQLGKTGRQVSVIGLGCEHLDGEPFARVKETVDAALEHKVNIFDVFMPGKRIREDIAAALGARRDKVMIQGHICSTDVNQQYDISRDMPTVRRYFDDMLRIFGGYIDFGMLFFIDSEEDFKNVFETDIADYADKLRHRGYIKHIGFSSHNPQTAIKAINTGLPEMMMFSVNPAFDMLPAGEYTLKHFDEGIDPKMLRGLDPKRAELYRLCAAKQIGVTVMKPLCAGKLLSKEHTPFSQPLTAPQCISYALSRPAVSCVLPGCKTPAEISDVMRYFELDDKEPDYAEILGAVKNDFRGSCVYCSHCLPCPAGIDIAAVNRHLDTARLDKSDIPSGVRLSYSELPRRGGDCTGCKNCEKRCPFGVSVSANMSEAESLFGA